MFDALIFDMDGVIVDTEIIYFRQLQEFLQAMGRNVSEEEIYPVVGQSGQGFTNILCQLLGDNLSGAEARQKLAEYQEINPVNIDYQTIFRHDLKKILQYSSENQIKIGLASSSPLETIYEVTESCEIRDQFQVIISGRMFKESKPNPEIYFHTARELAVPPKKCLVIEDSNYGIQAAKNAGMTVIAYEDERFGADQTQADFIEKDMNAILERIKKLVAK